MTHAPTRTIHIHRNTQTNHQNIDLHHTSHRLAASRAHQRTDEATTRLYLLGQDHARRQTVARAHAHARHNTYPRIASQIRRTDLPSVRHCHCWDTMSKHGFAGPRALRAPRRRARADGRSGRLAVSRLYLVGFMPPLWKGFSPSCRHLSACAMNASCLRWCALSTRSPQPLVLS